MLTGSDQGNLGYVKRIVASLGLSPQVHILGFVPRADVDRLYRAAFALIYPSFFGPDNLPPLEAFARNCPVAAASVPAPRTKLRRLGLVFHPIRFPAISRGQFSLCTVTVNCAPILPVAAGPWWAKEHPLPILRGYAKYLTISRASGAAGEWTTPGSGDGTRIEARDIVGS